jgi:hypothetical protein
MPFAFQDLPQLDELVQAIHLPQHLILIYLRRHTDPSYVAKVQRLSQTFSNVHFPQWEPLRIPATVCPKSTMPFCSPLHPWNISTATTSSPSAPHLIHSTTLRNWYDISKKPPNEFGWRFFVAQVLQALVDGRPLGDCFILATTKSDESPTLMTLWKC